ncbi:MAG: aminotransferase class I/II-fold pyridoxal phosphate-dependent enzyme [Actinobacteria bacterium]|nr:MAG: aminotransferase class I/II-fold pyridoxal phosphate-dependent enzyme [Actinomycetota bacterium]
MTNEESYENRQPGLYAVSHCWMTITLSRSTLEDRDAAPRRPDRLARLPEQYFVTLRRLVEAAAAGPGEPLIDLSRGNPEVGPPPHVVDALCAAARRRTAHGYASPLGLPQLKEALAERYRSLYGVELDPEREVAVVPGTKTAVAELALVLADSGRKVVLPDPGYPDCLSGVALAGARVERARLDAADAYAPDFASLPREAAALYLNYPSNPCAICAPPGVFDEAVHWAEETGTVVVHDLAYADLVFDGREPHSFLAVPGSKEVGVELYSMSKTYGMAGWRLGFVVGNAEVVARINLLTTHLRSGVFRPVQEAGIAALSGPQDSVEARRARYEARRDRVAAATGARSEGTFFTWIRLPEGVTAGTLLADSRVAVAPGEGFGARGTGWARISLAVPDDALDAALERIAPALS